MDRLQTGMQTGMMVRATRLATLAAAAALAVSPLARLNAGSGGGAAIVAAAGGELKAGKAGRAQTGLKTARLRILSGGGQPNDYLVEIARTASQQATGMMFRTEMKPDSGMIFPLDPPREAFFWMENTLIPLDIIFIGTDGRIRNIIPQARPQSRDLLASDGPVAAVLELKGGEAARIGARPGDEVRW